jgi:hypothetical protein
MSALYLQGMSDKNGNFGRLMHVLRMEMTTPAVASSVAITQGRAQGKAIDVDNDGKLSKEEIRDWISTCPSIHVEDRYSPC